MIKHSIVALVVALALLTACAPAEPMPVTQIVVETVTDEPVSTATFVPSDTPAPTATPLPTDTLVPSPTPTLGAPVTRTAAPAAECPPSGNPPPLTFSTIVDDEVVEAQLKAYLDAGATVANLQAALTDMKVGDDIIQGRVINQDVTGDWRPDIILDMNFSFYGDSGTHNATLIFWCDHGQYVSFTIGNLIAQLPEFGHHDGLQVIEDMNQDGVPEIVSSRVINWGIHGNTEREVRIFEWNGSGFDNLILGYQDYYMNQDYTAAYIQNGDSSIRDTDGDGYLELLLTGGRFFTNDSYDPEFFFGRDRTEVWAWNGSAFTLARWEYAPPKYRIQAVWDGDDASHFGDYAKALSSYQRAIFDEQLLARPLWLGSDSPDPEDRPRLSAYARYRIMLLHVIQGHLPEAQVVYDTLQKKFPTNSVGSDYAALATTFWEEYGAHQNIGLACAKAIEQAATNTDEVLDPLGYDDYSDEWPDFQPLDYSPEDICPFK